MDAVPRPPDESSDGVLGLATAWWSHFTGTPLERLQAREDLDWQLEEKEIRRIVWNLRVKHEEARAEAAARRSTAGRFTVLGATAAATAAGVALYGWTKLWTFVYPHPETGQPTVPADLWEMAVATTGATLLLLGTSTLLFRVSSQHHDRAAELSQTMVLARRLEIAVRLALGARASKVGSVRAALINLAMQTCATTADTVPRDQSLSAVPDSLREIADLVGKVSGRSD